MPSSAITILAATVGSVLFGISAALSDPVPIHLAVTYEITLAGLPAASEEIEAVFAGDTYDIRATTRTLGAIDLLVRFRSAARTHGVFVSGSPRPAGHSAENRWRGRERHVRLKYLAHGLEADVAPSPEEDERDPVPESMIQGAFDPVTAVLHLMLGAESATPCALQVPVFDGRRRYDLAAKDGGLKPAKDAGREVRVCKVAMVSLAGRSRNPFWPRRKEPREGEIWFEKLESRLPPIAILAKSQAGPAPIRIRLIAATIDGRPVDLRAAAPELTPIGHPDFAGN